MANNSGTLSKIDVAYAPGRAITCQAVKSPTDYREYDFLTEWDHPTIQAQDMIASASRRVASIALNSRKIEIEHQVHMPDPAEIFDFLASTLKAQPIGRIACVNALPMLDSKPMGFTHTSSRTAYALVPEIETLSHHEDIVPIARTELIKSVVIHEATHLAGLPDKVFYSMSPPHINAGVPTNLESHHDDSGHEVKTKGLYFEEGFASMIQAMYLWRKVPSLAKAEGAIPCRSPSSQTKLYIPARHAYRSGEQTYAAWGIERLVSIDSRIWDVLIASRGYKAESTAIRYYLKSLLDNADKNLFSVVDEVLMNTGNNIADLERIMDVTARIDRTARRLGS